jgi:hypothetical protein
VIEFGPLEGDDLGGLDLTGIAALIPVQVLTQGHNSSR